MAPAVTFRDVYKEYPFYQHITAGFKSFLFHLPKSIASLKKTRFVALKGISFQVEQGEVFGIIGKNGSGKSTILGLTAGVIKPDRGSVMTQGKISSLLELGAGFHPELSGIENIILNGILSGNTREEMIGKMQKIIEFSELGDFVYQPLRTYSSGMHARLGFAVAVHIDPEILLVDEALAVGDLEFKEKCNRKMKEFMESGATIIIVSHDMPAIAELCNRVAWIDSGAIMKIGSPKAVIRAYMDFLGIPFNGEEELSAESEREPAFNKQEEEKNPVDIPDVHTETLQGPATAVTILQGMPERLGSASSSWWDFPIVMRQLEKLITGDSGISFYEYLKKEHSIEDLRKGLSICRKLKGLEQSFIKYHTCAEFDVLNDLDVLDYPERKINDMKPNRYDLLLSVDALSHIGNLEAFLENVRDLLNNGGYIIALEYIGPRQHQWTEREVAIADRFSLALNSRSELMLNSDAPAGEEATPDRDTENEETAVSSDRVIPALKELFDIVGIRYFGGALHDLVLDKILCALDQTNKTDVKLIQAIMQCEQILIENGVLNNHYAMIIGRKRISHGG